MILDPARIQAKRPDELSQSIEDPLGFRHAV